MLENLYRFMQTITVAFLMGWALVLPFSIFFISCIFQVLGIIIIIFVILNIWLNYKNENINDINKISVKDYFMKNWRFELINIAFGILAFLAPFELFNLI